jgi:16S rRNA (uracil1498-N3)-methyltransferase
MTRRRWIADEIFGNRAALTGRHAAHLARVLRARVGQEFDIATGSDLRRGRITSIADARIEFELGEEVPAPKLPNITVVMSIFKFDRMEWAIEKSTELGASRIVPAIAARTEPHLAAAAPKRRERWERIALQASEQSRRLVPPEIVQPVLLKEAIGLEAGLRIVLSEVEQEVMLKHALESDRDGESLILALGPEGGWTDEELDRFEQARWVAASLGSMILRAETAAAAALSVVLAMLAG